MCDAPSAAPAAAVLARSGTPRVVHKGFPQRPDLTEQFMHLRGICAGTCRPDQQLGRERQVWTKAQASGKLWK